MADEIGLGLPTLEEVRWLQMLLVEGCLPQTPALHALVRKGWATRSWQPGEELPQVSMAMATRGKYEVWKVDRETRGLPVGLRALVPVVYADLPRTREQEQLVSQHAHGLHGGGSVVTCPSCDWMWQLEDAHRAGEHADAFAVGCVACREILSS